MGVEPKTYLMGVTGIDRVGMMAYLQDTGQEAFLTDLLEYGIDDPCALVSFYAKLCYKSLVMGENANLTGVRSIEDNLKGVIKHAHGAVFEHVWLNFVTTNCSRVFTHELVRHRVGTAFSQTSGRYVALENLEIVMPPELRPECQTCGGNGGDYPGDGPCTDCKGTGQSLILAHYENGESREVSPGELIGLHLQQTEWLAATLRSGLIKEGDSFDRKKKVTSAIRRIAPNGQTNEMGWSCNVRSLRHLLELRTSRHAEWEIRLVFNQVADIVGQRWPMMLHGAHVDKVDGLNEYSSLRV